MKLIRWLFVVVGLAVLGIFTRLRTVDIHLPSVHRVETELSQWRLAARQYEDGDFDGLASMDADASALLQSFVRKLVRAERAAKAAGGAERLVDPKLNQAADSEFLREAEEEAAAADASAGRAGALVSAEDEDAWPPTPTKPGSFVKAGARPATVGELPAWATKQRFDDIHDYYTTLVPNAGLLKQLRNVVRKTWKNWEKKDIWASYPSEDISTCPSVTPECLFWSAPSVNATVPDYPEAVNSNRSYRKCCVEHRKMREVTKNTFAALYDAGIDMWLGDGTLLGARRGHGTVIPWDTDIDVFAKKEDKKRIKQALQDAAAGGRLPHAWEQDRHGRSMLWVYWAKKRKVGDSHLEIWFTDGTNQRRNNFSLVFPLKPCPFYDFTVLCPNK
eukprot:gene12381-19148_t